MSPASAARIMYWAVNEKGELCGVILPARGWGLIEKSLAAPTALKTPYLSVAVTGMSTLSPQLRLITLNPETLYDFCYLKNAIYKLRRTPQKLKLDPASLVNHLGLADNPPLSTLKRFSARLDKGEFFTFMPDKSRVELYYLIEESEEPPLKLNVQVLWGIKGFGLPVAAVDAGHHPDEAEKAILNRTAVKPLPFWLRQMGRLFKRRRV